MRAQMGTFVTVTLMGQDRVDLDSLCDAAFAEVQRIENMMSFHSAESELSQLNHAPVGTWLSISADLFEVLALGSQLSLQTHGLFNLAVGRPLVHSGFLPGVSEAGWTQMDSPPYELEGLHARRVCDVWLDLGGIAKGYAVDCAVKAILKLDPHASGSVNAGGDLRMFGLARQNILDERDGSLWSTSHSSVASSEIIPHSTFTGYVDPRQRKIIRESIRATVAAESCMVADALTKIALLGPAPLVEQIASAYQAEVYFDQ